MRFEVEDYKQFKTSVAWKSKIPPKKSDHILILILCVPYLAIRPVCLCSRLPSAGVGEGLSPPVSPRSSLSSLWLRSDEKLKLDGVARCSVLL